MQRPSYSAFFFQAEDGIRDLTVTGVQTCALPIYHPMTGVARRVAAAEVHLGGPTGVRRPTCGEREHEPRRPRLVEMLTAARIPALVESATRIAFPTARAPGIFDWARMLSRWRSVSESAAAVRDVRDWPPPQAARSSARMVENARARIGAPIYGPVICRGAACCAPALTWEVPCGGPPPSRPRTGRSPRPWYRHSASPARS